MTESGTNQNERHYVTKGQPNQHEEHEEEEDFEGLMETVAKALRASEREAEASHAAKEGEGATAMRE